MRTETSRDGATVKTTFDNAYQATLVSDGSGGWTVQSFSLDAGHE